MDREDMNRKDDNKVQNKESNVVDKSENENLFEDLFAFEVVDTAYTCHENRNGGRGRG